jgi:hypothetical protein
VKGGPDPNCKRATEEIDATDRPQREIARGDKMANASMCAIVPLLGDNRTQRGHHQIDVNDQVGLRLGSAALVARSIWLE